jgi:CBS domain-containing protein
MMLVKHILGAARKRLAILSRTAAFCDVAETLMNPETPLGVVCDGDGVAVGVISRTDVIRALASARREAFGMCADAMMTRCFLSCRVLEPLQEVWETMSTRSLRSLPVLDNEGRPQGVVHARDIAGALLDEVTSEEILLRDYVLGIGYQ